MRLSRYDLKKRKTEVNSGLFCLQVLVVFAFFSGAHPKIIAYGTADVFFPFFPAVPFSFAGPVNLACLAAIHFWIRRALFLHGL